MCRVSAAQGGWRPDAPKAVSALRQQPGPATLPQPGDAGPGQAPRLREDFLEQKGISLDPAMRFPFLPLVKAGLRPVGQ